MDFIRKLFGGSPFRPLVEHTKKVHECVLLIRPIADALVAGDHEKLGELQNQMSKTEHEADVIKDEIRKMITGVRFFSIGKYELTKFLSVQDTIADAAEDFSVVVLLRKTSIHPAIKDDFLVFVGLFGATTEGGTSAGVAWRSIGPGQFGAMFGVAISPHDSDVIAAGTDMGNAFMTRDGGQTWKILGRSGGSPFANPGYRGVWGVHFDPILPERIWIGSEHGLFRSTDGGASWGNVLGGGADYTIAAITTDPTDSDIVYAATGRGARVAVSWARGDVWKSVDGGETWWSLDLTDFGPEQGQNWTTIAVDPQSDFQTGRGHARLYVCGQGDFTSRRTPVIRGSRWRPRCLAAT